MRSVLLVTVLFLLVGQAANTQTVFREIQRPPYDTADARAMRIWVPAEIDGRHMLKVELTDGSNKVVRTLVNRLLKRGYYNFYWDKRDDSGQLVEAGRYTCKITFGSQVKYEEMIVEFNYWEQRSHILWPDELRAETVKFRLDEDSSVVSIRVMSQLGKLVDSAVVDSIMPAGAHEWRWTPGGQPVKGRYHIELQVGDYVHQTFMYRN